MASYLYPPTADLWAITCYFNPMGYRRRLENYHAFRRQLKVPLVTVELSYGGPHALQTTDADILIQIPAQDVMWQKERLLDVALRAVPAYCKKVAWIDCDIVFERPDWAVAVSRRLDLYPLVQPYHELVILPREANGFRPDRRLAPPPVSSLAYGLLGGERLEDILNYLSPLYVKDGERRPRAGFCCAFRRELFEKRGFYAGGVVGGGDRAIACAAFGLFETAAQNWYMNAQQEEHFRAWAEPFYRDVRGELHFVDGAIYHLWHGEMAHRRYAGRHRGLRPFDFDPAVDVALDEHGCGRWNSDKPEMHDFVRSYFEGRQEDGEFAPAASLPQSLIA